MGREERKLKKHLQQREITERRKLAQKGKRSQGVRPVRGDAEGVVVEVNGGACTVRSEGEDLRCRASLDVATGDRVLFSRELRRLERLLPRVTVLSRPDPHNPRIQLVIAANIDVVVNVVSLGSPPLRPGLIDRYLIAIERSGASPLLCVNKIDLEETREPLDCYRELGIPMVFCSARTGAGLEELRSVIAGRMAVFAGHSGVGKSTLLNALAPGFDAATGDVSEVHKKGRHTTTASRLYELPNGAVIIDTPGIRELGLWEIEPRDVRRYFHEFDECGCAFRDCSHTHEPRCGVKEALSAGGIRPERYSSYLRIMHASGESLETVEGPL